MIILDTNGLSHHSLPEYYYQGKIHKFNSNNIGLGLTLPAKKFLDWKLGFYKNSYYKTTFYGGANAKVDLGPFSAGLFLGLATGYNNTPMHSGFFQPVVMPNVEVAFKHIGIMLGYLPATTNDIHSVSAYTLQFEYYLK